MPESDAALTHSTHRASHTLAHEVKHKVRENGLVVWLDTDGVYGGLADALAAGSFGFTYPVVSYRGSYLELMLALQNYGNDVRPEHLLIHLPGVNKDTVKETPAYELAAAGKMYERNLGTVVREAAVGVARPEDVDTFLRTPGLTLAQADAWLEAQSSAPHDRLSLLLHGLGVDDVVVKILSRDRSLVEHLPAGADKLLTFLEKGIGLDAGWRRFRLGDAELGLDAAASLVASWLMAVEFVSDLRGAGHAGVTPTARARARCKASAQVGRGIPRTTAGRIRGARGRPPASHRRGAHEPQSRGAGVD